MREQRGKVGGQTLTSADNVIAPEPGKQTLVQLQAERSLPPMARTTQVPTAGGGQQLPAGIQTKMESSFATDFSGVRVHEGAHVSGMGALAYAQGTDLHFAPGQYQPQTHTGQALIGHELAHVVQQRDGRVAAPAQAKGASVVADPGLEDEADRAGQAAARGEPAGLAAGSGGSAAVAMPKLADQPIQCFGSQEHQSLGNTATGSASYDVGGAPNDRFELTHGDIIALSGDYFLAGPGTNSAGGKGAGDDLFNLSSRPGNRGQAAGTRDEIVYTLKLIRGDDARFKTGGAWATYTFSEAVTAAVDERYKRLAAANTTHFAAPRGRDASGQPNPSPEGSAGNSYRSTHEVALRMAFQAGQRREAIDRGMAMEAAAQHYLTDAFSSGHLRTPIGDLRQYWSEKYPLFWYNVRHKIALDTAIRLNDQSNNITTAVATVNQMYGKILAKVEAMAGSLPPVTLGDLLSKVFHDQDNEQGVDVQGGGKMYGDGNLDKADPNNRTRASAQGAIRDGNADVQNAYKLGGQMGPGQVVPDADICYQVRAATGTGDRYLAETRMPVPVASLPQQNWRAGSLEELWDKTVTGTAGPTIGVKIVEALQPGHEIRDTLQELADKFPVVDPHATGDLKPKQAYLDGFLAPLVANPRAGLIHIINWAPNYGLASNSRDDQSLASGQELDKAHQLNGMTTPARVAYIKELLDGYTADDEGALVVRIFETAPSGERRPMYRQIEGHDWTGEFKHGWTVSDDRLWNSLNKSQLTQLRGIING